MSNLKVRDKKVLVAPPARENKTVGGFITPTTSNNFGVISGLGSELTKSSANELQIGMKVYYGSKFEQVEIDNQKMFLMEADNIFAVRED